CFAAKCATIDQCTERHQKLSFIRLCIKLGFYDQDEKSIVDRWLVLSTSTKVRLIADDFKRILQAKQNDWIRRTVCPPATTTTQNETLLDSLHHDENSREGGYLL
ncbi:6355_t:CDS:1, partial [Paraglomus brasilianum]